MAAVLATAVVCQRGEVAGETVSMALAQVLLNVAVIVAGVALRTVVVVITSDRLGGSMEHDGE